MGAHPLKVMAMLAGYTVPQLAAKAGVSWGHVYRWMRGEVRAGDETRERLAKLLGVPASRLPSQWPRSVAQEVDRRRVRVYSSCREE
ncbi:MAG: helix-turn-helix transcriptional regulator [Bacillota bacterium]